MVTPTGLQLRGVLLAPGDRPAIIVPITGRDEVTILIQADEVAASAADMAEWRADYFLADGTRQGDVSAMMTHLRRHLHDKPLLFTVRTSEEGGLISPTSETYLSLLATGLASGVVDLVDIQSHQPGARQAVEMAHAAGVPVLASWHDVTGTPDTDTMRAVLVDHRALGADAAKIAVLARRPGDAERLMVLARQASRDLGIPLIAVAMGELGRPTRLLGRQFGSCATFASLESSSSAPGQLPVEAVAAALDAQVSAAQASPGSSSTESAPTAQPPGAQDPS